MNAHANARHRAEVRSLNAMSVRAQSWVLAGQQLAQAALRTAVEESRRVQLASMLPQQGAALHLARMGSSPSVARPVPPDGVLHRG